MDNVLHIPLEDSSRESDKQTVFRVVEAGDEQQPFTDEVAKALQSLWSDKGVRKSYDMRSEFQLNDSAKYFLDNISRIHEPGYRPTDQDILYSRVATTGVVEVKFRIKDLDFRVFDVGGQRSERRKWIHCFDNVESIIFITAISEYDQVLFEDETTNRMVESMQLFSSICNSSWFLNTAMILFLNKKDLFADKIQRVNITTCFPDYEGGQNYDEAVNFIKVKFNELNQHPDKKSIYMHETCATDTNQVQMVISSVCDMIIQKNLQKAGMILRAFAIFFVLLFHMWPSKIRFGYLGVDMFFVISGYLIFMLLSRKRPINGPKTLDFYFRRIKRIVPIYLFIVACVLFSIYHLLAPIEFTQVVEETLPALGFYSNMPSARPFKYFDLSSKLFFFLHTWSLSVEMQFYLTVPILFFALEYVDKVRSMFRYLLLSVIPLSSFCFQTFSTALIVGRDNESSALLTNKFLVVIGDASYSIYLIHWSFFTWHRYENMSMYANGQEADFMTGSTLIVISMVAGYLVEKMFKYILRYIDGWSFLVAFLFFGYYVNSMLIYQLHSNAINLNDVHPDHKMPEWEKKVRLDTIKLWNQRDNMPTYITKEVNDFNSEFIHAYQSFAFCDDLNRQMPTHFNLNMSSYDLGTSYTCHTKGNGTKNIVLIGNSHIVHNFPGIWYLFRNVYKTLTLFARNSCIPASRKFQQPARTDKVKDECVRLLYETVQALQQWREPVDIVIALYALIEAPDPPIAEDIKHDEFLNELQNFYSALGEIPREALIMYENFPLFTQVPINEVSARLRSGKPLDTIGDSKKALMDKIPTLRMRSEHIKCDKCIKMKFIDNWCHEENDFCNSVEKQGLIYFADTHHPSVFGSFYNARKMLERYNEFNGEDEKKAAESAPQGVNDDQQADGAAEDNETPVAAVIIEEQFNKPHQSLTRTPAINSYAEGSIEATRLAFVGAIESGKSTICQQFRSYCKQVPHEIELQHRPGFINDFLFFSMDRLLKLMPELGLKLADPENAKSADIVQANLADRRGRPLLPHELDALAMLWEDPGIQETYNYRSRINMNDSVKYFFNCIDRVAEIGYVPTQEDLCMLYIPTVGIIHNVYEINGETYSVYDVSGRMLERKKWLGFYDGFDAVVFTIAISEFDQEYENESGKHSRLKHAFDLLGETASDQIFNATPLFIFLNEVDIFKEKLARVSLKDYFPEYEGSSDKEALNFMKDLALKRCESVNPENLTIYYTTAINTKKMHKCFNELLKRVGK
ncbi:Odr-3 [Aphelenchoides bicaudatus]|nr:Odr-3 [Aphelenchoides bicaudatus]